MLVTQQPLKPEKYKHIFGILWILESYKENVVIMFPDY